MDLQVERLFTWRTGGLFVVALLAGVVTATVTDGIVPSAAVLVATLVVLLVADYFQW
ncbi:hypothetical protein [Haloarchaeobius sp. FL176]|uniref:hypothetical protein n=1 Tax=Haloarchaeobius sp. FL176 TaxID=2967129 RepID=UPI002148F7E1|nr:hypothetical protein [Haloarchaeobius sp. FL176]